MTSSRRPSPPGASSSDAAAAADAFSSSYFDYNRYLPYNTTTVFASSEADASLDTMAESERQLCTLEKEGQTWLLDIKRGLTQALLANDLAQGAVFYAKSLNTCVSPSRSPYILTGSKLILAFPSFF